MFSDDKGSVHDRFLQNERVLADCRGRRGGAKWRLNSGSRFHTKLGLEEGRGGGRPLGAEEVRGEGVP